MQSSAQILLIATLAPLAGLMLSCQADYQSLTGNQSDRQNPAFRLSAAAFARTRVRVVYDGAYRAIDYPDGDVANNRGVCSDVVIRAYRALGIDLQRLVHEDMTQAFKDYPNRWGLTRPDPNIDHRRVPNLEQFFERQGAALPGGKNADFQQGDVVSWRLPHGAPHIGIVHAKRSRDRKRPLVVHNIGWGPVLDDSLFRYKITGHYRFFGVAAESIADSR